MLEREMAALSSHRGTCRLLFLGTADKGQIAYSPWESQRSPWKPLPCNLAPAVQAEAALQSEAKEGKSSSSAVSLCWAKTSVQSQPTDFATLARCSGPPQPALQRAPQKGPLCAQGPVQMKPLMVGV